MRQVAYLVGILLFLALAGSLVPAWVGGTVSTEPRSMMASGFVNDHGDVGPGTWYWSDYMDLRVDHPEDTNIVIWNHHTEAMPDAPSCMSSNYFPPRSIIKLEAIGRTRVYYLCTKTSQAPDKPFYAIQRREEIIDLVSRFRELGVPAERIFLAGQSGGSCSSLFALGAAPEQMNAGILFAPACFGRTEGQRRSNGILDERSAEIDRQLLAHESVTALLVAFTTDAWNKPEDLAYITGRWPETAQIFSPGCGANHGGAFHGCGLDAIDAAVRTYFLRRLVAGGVPLPEGVELPAEDEG